jgi:ubiquinone/menaquinone biosynthesis C-methylase UbiE
LSQIQKDETHWSRFAANFDADNDYVIGEPNMALILDKVAKQKDLGRTLELACGSGIYSQVIAREADELVCTDWSEAMVEATRAKLHTLSHVTVEKANCFDLPCPDNRFDTVFVANLLHIIPEPGNAVAEAKRVLKSGGRIMVLDFTFDGMTLLHTLGLMFRYFRKYGLPQSQRRGLSVLEIRTILENNGLQIQEATLIGDTVKAAFVVATVNEQGLVSSGGCR